MAEENKNRSVVNVPKDAGLLVNFTRMVRLVMRLIGDNRVNFLLKILPLGALAYMIIPDPLPYIDDALILGLGTYVFVELCPEDIVEEHRAKLWGESKDDSEDVLDASFKDKPEE
jgi:uncharacterized membrane protein YkvA (DUF1232 family)